jgi:hypothetical protein
MQANIQIIESAQLAADKGWRASFQFTDGRRIDGAYITAADWDVGAVKVEKVGERHLPPTLIYLKDLLKVEVDWS